MTQAHGAIIVVWMTETRDRCQYPESAEVVAPFEAVMHEWFGTPAGYKRRN